MTENEFWQILANMPLPEAVSLRLYHDADGMPLCYTQEDLPGTYIEVDAETYALASMNVRVQNNTLIKNAQPVQKLMVSHTGTPCHPDNVAIVVDDAQPHQRWSMKSQ